MAHASSTIEIGLGLQLLNMKVLRASKIFHITPASSSTEGKLMFLSMIHNTHLLILEISLLEICESIGLTTSHLSIRKAVRNVLESQNIDGKHGKDG